MPERDELADIRERITKLEVKFEEMTKRVDAMATYMKELYKYLQHQPSRSLI